MQNLKEINGNKLNLTIIVNESKEFYKIELTLLKCLQVKNNKKYVIVDEGDPFNELLNTRSINKLNHLTYFLK